MIGWIEFIFYIVPSTVTSQQTFDVVKTSWRFLQRNNFFVFEDVFKTCLQDIFLKTSWKLRKILKDVLKASWRRILQTRLEDVLEDEKLLHWRSIQDVLENRKCLLGAVWLWQSFVCNIVFSTYVQRWSFCSNRPAIAQVSVKWVEVVVRS